MANVDIRLGHKNTAWFTTNSTLVLKDGQMVVCSDGANQGKYKIGDGLTQLSALTFYGGVSVSPAWGSITGTLSSQTDLQTALNGKQNTITTGTTSQYFRGDLSLATFPTNVSSFANDSGYITSSALSPYLTSATAASTYQPLLGFTAENVANKATSFATLNNTLYPTTQAVSNYVTGLGYITSSALTPYLTIASAASTYQPIGSYLTGNQTITVSGDASGSGATSIALTLATVNSNVGTFNNVTVNAKGLVTAASNVSYLTGLTVGSTTIGSGTNTRILYNNAGVLGEYLVTGTGTTAVLSTSPTFTTGIQINAGTNSGRSFELFQDTASVKIGSRVGTTSQGAIYFSAASPSDASSFVSGSTSLLISGGNGLNVGVGGTPAWNLNSFNEHTYTNIARSSGATTAFTWTKANSTGQTASTNIQGFLFTTGSRQWATGAITTQEEIRITSPTYSFVGASTITNAYTLFVNSPTAGTNATITNNWSLGTNGNLLSQGSLVSSSPSGGVGYFTGAGAAVTQLTSRTTGVTINNVCGAITLVSAAGTTTWQSFTVINSRVAATDVVIVNQDTGTDLYQIFVTNVSAGSFQITFATTGGTTTEQPIFNFAVIKAVTS